MSSARAQAAGCATFPQGVIDWSAACIATSITGAITAGGAELVHPIPVGQDGHEGIEPSDDEQQSIPPIVGGVCIERASLEGASSEAAEGDVAATWCPPGIAWWCADARTGSCATVAWCCGALAVFGVGVEATEACSHSCAPNESADSATPATSMVTERQPARQDRGVTEGPTARWS